MILVQSLVCLDLIISLVIMDDYKLSCSMNHFHHQHNSRAKFLIPILGTPKPP